jgi:undecaprenyl-diphosphatase
MDFEFIRATLLAFIQGLTEFLPVSSSAHLILPSALLGWEDQGLGFDVAVHLGTLAAVILYFRRDVIAIISGCIGQLIGRGANDSSRLGWQLLIATLPVIIVGFLAKDVVDGYLRTTWVIAVSTMLFGALLWWSDWKSTGHNSLKHITWETALFIGFAQILALVPGTSRSGITMTAALFCNLDRESSSRFSFLLSIPVIAGAGLLLFLDLLQQQVVNWGELAYAMSVAGLIAFVSIHFFLTTIKNLGFMPFVIYRLILGAVLFLFFV